MEKESFDWYGLYHRCNKIWPTGNVNVPKVRKITESDGRYMVPDIVKSVDCVPK